MNAMTSMILNRYVEWDRYADKFGFVTITRNGFKSFIEAIDDEKLSQVARGLGGTNPKEMMLFWYKKLNIDTFLRYLSAYCRYGRIAEYEVDAHDGTYIITIHHELGEKYSRFLAGFFGEAIRTTLGAIPRSELGGNSVTLRFALSGSSSSGA